MKIKCPLCDTINYFSGIEEGNKICSNCNCNITLPEPKIPNATENPYFKIKNSETSTNFLGSKKMLDKETFSNLLFNWMIIKLNIERVKELFEGFLKSLSEFRLNKVTENIFYKEIVYLYVWLAYTNCINVFQNNKNIIDAYFPYFTKKIYILFSMFPKVNFDGYKEEEWERNLTKKINGYVDAYNLSLDSKNFSFLGGEFYKNLYRKEGLDAIAKHIFSIFILEELKASFESLGKELTKYKI
jgi:hypothetical protein